MRYAEIVNLFEGEQINREVLATPQFRKTFSVFAQKYPSIVDTLNEFLTHWKTARGDQSFGKKDNPMVGPLKGFRRCHLVHGKAILIYQTTPTDLRLLSVEEHNAIEGGGRDLARLAAFVNSRQSSDYSIYAPPAAVVKQSAAPQSVPLSAAESKEILELFGVFAKNPNDRGILEKLSKNDITTFMDWARMTVGCEDDSRDKEIIKALGGRDMIMKRAKLYLEKTKSAA